MISTTLQKRKMANGLRDDYSAVLSEVRRRTGFMATESVMTHYTSNGEVRSELIRGMHGGKRAVLKVQGQMPELDERTAIDKFMRQNNNRHVRAPKIY